MELIAFYILFCLTTTLTGMYELFLPVIKDISENHSDALIVKNLSATYTAIVLVSLVLAPAILLPCLIPSMGARFKEQLKITLLKN